MDTTNTALVMIGYQNDYFAADGILHSVIETTAPVARVLGNTVDLLNSLCKTPLLIISTPIVFAPEYPELTAAVGILRTIKEVGAFSAGTTGAETVPELQRFGDRILEVPGKRGLNAFSNTNLHDLLSRHSISHVVFAGVVTSICIDSTARSAHDRGFRVTILSDCTCGRSMEEQDFYCQDIFPLYANVTDGASLRDTLGVCCQ